VKFNSNFLIGIGYITFIMGVAFGDIGEIYPSEPNPWYLPLLIGLFMGFPFLLGYLAGKEQK